MPGKQKVELAAVAARRVAGEVDMADSSLSQLTRLMSRFSVIEFEVPEISDADGYLFQYGRVDWFSEPTFALGLVRQLEVVDSSGEHESYVQVQFEFRYALDGDLEGVSSHSEWWFPGGGEVSFHDWLNSVNQNPIATVLAGKAPRDFEIWQETV